MSTGNGTNIETGAVAGFAKEATDIKEEMAGLLRRTDATVQAAISPSVWGGSASRQFGGVAERYQVASKKLEAAMQEILTSVSTGAKNFEGTEDAAASGISKAASGGLTM